MSQWVRSEKKVSLETIKLSTTSPPLVYLLHCCLHMQVSDMKSQPGLFVISISGPAATTSYVHTPTNSLPRHPLRTI